MRWAIALGMAVLVVVVIGAAWEVACVMTGGC